jgi:hypothetical protein
MAVKGALCGGADEWALAPAAPGVEVACPVVSRRLRDPIEGVADRASHPLNGQALWNLHTCQASDARQVARGSGRWFVIRALALVGAGLVSGSRSVV